MHGKRLAIGGLGGGAAVLCAASVAWACTYQPRIFGLSTDVTQPNTAVTLSGQALANQGLVEIHWDGAAGPKLGQAAAGQDGNFTTQVTVPADATADVHYLVAVAGTTVARTAIEVTAPAPAAGSTSAVPAQTAQSDAWTSGFSQSRPGTSSGASLVDSSASNSASPGLAIGAGLLGGGLVALGGLGVATVRRRRATVQI